MKREKTRWVKERWSLLKHKVIVLVERPRPHGGDTGLWVQEREGPKKRNGNI